MEHFLKSAWQVPLGELSFQIDPLSAIFIIPILILVFSAACYAVGYLRSTHGAKIPIFHVFSYLTLTIALLGVVTANNIILFLGAWELMTLSTYFLIMLNDKEKSVRKAGLLYLVMTHCGTFCLFIMFFFLNYHTGFSNFDEIHKASFSNNVAGIVFCLALLGFGVKAGFFPIHVWLPHAHPAAPSHVSALLSGVAIKTGIYGLCRIIWILKILPDWSGYFLILIGVSSGIMGVLYALGQHEIKKLLAYHSIENIGIITLGLGTGLLGITYQTPALAVFGFGGGLLHMLNHSLFKGLLFLNAGTVIQKTRSGEMDRLGGVAKVMPKTSGLFIVGALSICGLPFFNGFVSEFMIFFALFLGLFALPIQGVVSCAIGILSLALMGALALACFSKVYGSVFLGEPRSDALNAALQQLKCNGMVDAGGVGGKRPEAPITMLLPMFFLAALCILIGLMPELVSRHVFIVGEYLFPGRVELNYGVFLYSFSTIMKAYVLMLLVILFLALLRRSFHRRFSASISGRPTWRCGFSLYSPRMQYSSSSFALPIIEFFKKILLFRRQGNTEAVLFPDKAHSYSYVQDMMEILIFRPVYHSYLRLANRAADKKVRYTQMYLMYIFVFLLSLLIWKMK